VVVGAAGETCNDERGDAMRFDDPTAVTVTTCGVTVTGTLQLGFPSGRGDGDGEVLISVHPEAGDGGEQVDPVDLSIPVPTLRQALRRYDSGPRADEELDEAEVLVSSGSSRTW
jgi:hypothetical protein